MRHPVEKVGMIKKWIAITLLLLASTALLARRLQVSILRFYAENDPAKIQPVQDVRQKIAQENPPPPLASAKKYAPAEFAVIPESNVFSESRSKEEKAEATAQPETPPLTQKPILVGVTIADSLKKASIIDPTSPSPDKNRRAQIKRVGDVYHGYTITDITLEQIVLESGTRREIIPLHEGSKRTQGGKTPILSTRVVSFGGTSSGGAPVNVSSGTPARTTVASVGSPATAAKPASSAPAPASSRTAEVIEQAAPARQAPRSQNIETDAQGRRIIRTPFGTIYRPNRD
jgi:hypothetical protein